MEYSMLTPVRKDSLLLNSLGIIWSSDVPKWASAFEQLEAESDLKRGDGSFQELSVTRAYR